MIPVLFINCALFPFVEWIISGAKLYETRARNTLKRLVGQPVYIAETGHGEPVIKCLATISGVEVIRTRFDFEKLRDLAMIAPGCKYDWADGTTVKYFYKIENVFPVPNFIPPEGTRHGRTWMEYVPRTYSEQIEPAEQWIADCYHCSDILGQKMTPEEMYIDLF